ncbi:MAG: hypothetical protein AAGU75_19175, partial [Bacillota bacterium]
EEHPYTMAFGTPSRIYTIDGVRVTVKSTLHGSHYDLEGICKDCPYFPCHEGVYDLFMLPDDRLCGCRWSSTSVSNGKDFQEALNSLIKVYQRADWYLPEEVTSMTPYPEFVAHEVKYKGTTPKKLD